jgi:hypothetical protein
MPEGKIEVDAVGFSRLLAAVEDAARPEIVALADAVITDLRTAPPVSLFDEVAARHIWDEYCWILQEGPFDEDEYVDDRSLGSVSGAGEDLVRSYVDAQVEKLPKHTRVFLSLFALERSGKAGDVGVLGRLWSDGMADLVMEEINERAARRMLDLIGPNKSDAIRYEIGGEGVVWSTLSDRDKESDILASHSDCMIKPNADLSAFAAELVEAFIEIASNESAGSPADEFFREFEGEIKKLLIEQDVRPALESMRAGLLERLDG